MKNPIDVIKDPEVKKAIVNRCGENPISDGLKCPHCGCLETFQNAAEPGNVDKWFFMIRAYRVDDSSECKNCGNWF